MCSDDVASLEFYPLINTFIYLFFVFWLNSGSVSEHNMHKMPPKSLGEGRALGAGETARLIMLFSNDRIICYGSFDSSHITSLCPASCISLKQRRVLLAGWAALLPLMCHLATVKYHCVEDSQEGGGSRDSWGKGRWKPTTNKTACPWGISHSDPSFSKQEGI